MKIFSPSDTLDSSSSSSSSICVLSTNQMVKLAYFMERYID